VNQVVGKCCNHIFNGSISSMFIVPEINVLFFVPTMSPALVGTLRLVQRSG
jgi:hypothetical protein